MYKEVIETTVPNSTVRISAMSEPTEHIGICRMHIHDEYEIMAVKSGYVIYDVDGKKQKVCPGDIIFINSSVPHATESSCFCESFFIQFRNEPNAEFQSSSVLDYLSRFINNDENEYVLFKCGDRVGEEIKKYMYDIHSEYIEKKASYDVYIKSGIYGILGALYRNKVLINPESFFDVKNIQKIMPVLEYIDMHYNEQINLSDMSNLINLNESYFCRLFKKIVNTTLIQYINFIRICKAERMLSSTDKSISDISYDTGFSSISYFNRTFKKYKYCTPTHYQKIKYGQNL